MELESGSSSVGRCGASGRRRASDGGAHPADGACARECRCAVLDRRVAAHRSRDVGDHVIENAGCDRRRWSRAIETPCDSREVERREDRPHRHGPPHRGHAHVARAGGVSVGVGAVGLVAGAGGEDVVRTFRARATRVTRQVFARNPDWRMRTKPRASMCWTNRREIPSCAAGCRGCSPCRQRSRARRGRTIER